MVTLRGAHLASGVAAIAAYPFLPAELQNGLYLLISATVPIAISVGLARHRPPRRRPWVLIAIGYALYVLGDVIYTVLEYTADQVPYPNIGDVSYLLYYPLVFTGLAGFVSGAGRRDRTAWLDASIWTIGAALVMWEPLVEPYVSDPASRTLGGAVGAAYPLLDICLLLLVLRMITGRPAHTTAYWLLTAGLTMQTGADVVYAFQVLQIDYRYNALLDLGWLASYVAVGAAALSPSMRTMSAPGVVRDPTAGRLRLLGLLIPALVAPGLLRFAITLEGPVAQRLDGFVLVIGASLLVFLVVARAFGLVSLIERRSRQLVERQQLLEAALVERERVAASLHHRVNRDTLTGLANRDRFVAELQAALDNGTAPSVAFLDLDDFKTVNDTLGHEAGDLLLIEVGRRLAATVRPGDLVARFGGDEFAVLVNGDVEEAVDGMLRAMQPAFVVEGREMLLQMSVGVTTADDEPTSTGDMLRCADIAMYTAKRAGGGWARYLPSMSAVLRERVDLRARLVAALHRGEVVPWFQPLVDIDSGELRGFEALARWVTADGTVVAPPDWLPMAEETGLIVSIDLAIGRAAVAQLAAWRRTYEIDALYLSINMSARTLERQGMADEFLAALTEHDVPANRVVIEVTEGVLIDDELVSARLQVLRAAGIRVALDDFGTGWSSLSYLQRFPVDQLKLDRTFTAELGTGVDAEAIPAAVLQLARALSLEVVAEGVETLEQAESLAELGFQTAQGHLFGPAEPADALVGLLASERPQFVPAALSRRLAGLGKLRASRARALAEAR